MQFIEVNDHQSDDKFNFWWPFWIFPPETFSTCRRDGGFVDYDSGEVFGHLQIKSAFSIFSRLNCIAPGLIVIIAVKRFLYEKA